jgi:uncharacterized protein (TIGR03067 family)
MSRRPACCLAFAALLLAVTDQTPARQPAEPKPKPDSELIQGPWSVVGLEAGGKAQPEKAFRGNTFTFTKDKAVLKEWAYPSIEYTFALDPTKAPKAIELTTTKGGHVVHGMYKLDGDELTLCVSVGGSQRPTEFATKAGGDTETFTLRRLKWEKYTDKATGFTFEVPGKPEERTRMADTPAGPVTTTLVAARNDNDRVTYLVSSAALPAKPDARGTEAAMEAMQKVVLAEAAPGAKATMESERFKQPAGVSAAREYTVTLELPNSKDKGMARVRLYVAGDRAYALAVFGQEEGTRSANVTRFWNSFRLPGEKKDRDPPQKQ